MTLRLALILIVVTGAGFAGCGNDAKEEIVPPSEYVSDQGVPVSVAQIFGDNAPIAKEGFRSYVRIDHGSTGVIARGPIRPRISDVPDSLTKLRLLPGQYTATVSQRACGPSGCEATPPDPAGAMIECSGDFEVTGKEPVDVVAFVDGSKGECDVQTGFVELG